MNKHLIKVCCLIILETMLDQVTEVEAPSVKGVVEQGRIIIKLKDTWCNFMYQVHKGTILGSAESWVKEVFVVQ